MRTMRWIGVLGWLAALGAPAGAREQVPAVPALNPAWDRLAASNARFLTQDQQVLLDDLAFATAMVEVCEGFQVDKERFKQGFEGFKSDEYMKLPPEKKRAMEYRLMVNFGATVALYTAEGLMHQRRTCAVAEGKRRGGPGRFWVQPAAGQ